MTITPIFHLMDRLFCLTCCFLLLTLDETHEIDARRRSWLAISLFGMSDHELACDILPFLFQRTMAGFCLLEQARGLLGAQCERTSRRCKARAKQDYEKCCHRS